MKTTTLLLTAAAGIAFVSAASAADVVRSPRAEANQIARVAGVNADRNLVSGWYAGTAHKAFNTPPSMVASGPVADINLVSGSYLGAAAKNPARDLRGVAFEIAPLIEKRDAATK